MSEETNEQPTNAIEPSTLLDSLYEKNTEAIRRDCGDGIIEWDVFLNVDHQGFCVAREIEDEALAVWVRQQLALALVSLVESNEKVHRPEKAKEE